MLLNFQLFCHCRIERNICTSFYPRPRDGYLLLYKIVPSWLSFLCMKKHYVMDLRIHCSDLLAVFSFCRRAFSVRLLRVVCPSCSYETCDIFSTIRPSTLHFKPPVKLIIASRLRIYTVLTAPTRNRRAESH